jgi:hypothetical protein
MLLANRHASAPASGALVPSHRLLEVPPVLLEAAVLNQLDPQDLAPVQVQDLDLVPALDLPPTALLSHPSLETPLATSLPQLLDSPVSWLLSSPLLSKFKF